MITSLWSLSANSKHTFEYPLSFHTAGKARILATATHSASPLGLFLQNQVILAALIPGTQRDPGPPLFSREAAVKDYSSKYGNIRQIASPLFGLETQVDYPIHLQCWRHRHSPIFASALFRPREQCSILPSSW